MEGLRGFALDLIVIDHRVFADDEFGDGVGEVVAGAGIGLDDRALRVGADDDQSAGE